MSAEKPQFLPDGISRVQRVNLLERVFQHAGDSDHASFQRALVYERLMESGYLSIQQAAFFESALELELRKKLAAGLNELRKQRETTFQ